MQKLLAAAEKIIDGCFEKKVGVLVWAMGFAGIVGLRVFIEGIVVPVKDMMDGVIVDYLHYLIFFLILFLVVWLILKLFIRIQTEKLAFLLLAAAWLIIFPPLFDLIKTGGQIYWSFYLLDDVKALFWEFLTVFGNLPSGVMYFGTKILFISAVILISGIIYLKTRDIFKSLAGLFLSYLSFFILASFPSWLAFIYYFLAEKRVIWEIKGYQVVQLFAVSKPIFGLSALDMKYAFAFNLNQVYYPLLLCLLSGLFWLIDREKFLAVIKNVRPPQMIYHGGLLLAGLGLGFWAYPANFNLNLFSFFSVADLLVSIWLAWIASVIINDVYDYRIDAVSNSTRPLQAGVFEKNNYQELGVAIFLLSLLGGLIVGVKFMLVLLAYQFLAWAYSAPPFRLKKFPIIATLISSLASVLIVLAGFLIFSGDENIIGLPWRMIFLLILALTLSLPIKDFKDIAGDKEDGIWTIPVIFGEANGRLVVATGIFISFMVSVFFLNEFRLFWWAIIFGAAAFWIVLNKKPRQLFWWVMGVVTIYGIILVKILFL